MRFSAYVDDHLPPHVHGRYAGVEVILDLVDGKVRLARRKDRIMPTNAKRSAVNHVLRTATHNADALANLWRLARG